MRSYLLLGLAVTGCSATLETTSYPTLGSIEMVTDGVIPDDANIEDLGGEFGWSEGPVWIDKGYLLFTDVPGNAIWKFDDMEGLSLWMKPSGSDPVANYSSSPGANGLFWFNADEILVPDHGNRALYALNIETQNKRLLADQYKGQRFNSPNDVVVHKSGTLFFTDPPYGLKDQDESPAKELNFNGVYALSETGELTLIDRSLTRPNGIALSPDHSTLYVANSDPEDSKFIAYDVTDTGIVSNPRLFLDVQAERLSEGFGNPDGMAVATDGTIFATGPGGVLVLSPDGEKLGLIRTGKPVANVAFGDADGQMLYMTSFDRLMRVKTRKTGLGFPRE